MRDNRNPTITPGMFNASGGGVIDDAASVVSANSVYGIVTLYPGMVYRVSSNISVGTIVNLGGVFSIDAGVALSYDCVSGDPNTVCFTGQGSARSRSASYSIGHYEGASLDKKWDMARRAFIANAFKEVHAYKPKASNPAALAEGVWALDNKVIVDDPENLIDIFQHGPWGARSPMQTMIEYSPAAKTENINWVLGLELDGRGIAVHGETIHGGARIHHQGYSAIVNVTGNPVNVINDLFPMDELWYQWLNLTDFGGIGLNISGGAGATAGTGVVLGGGVDHLFFNGAKSTATNIYKLSGNVDGFRILEITENTYPPAGLYEPTESVGLVENNSYGGPQNCEIGFAHLKITTKPALISRDTTGGTGTKFGLEIGKQFARNGTTIPLQLAWCDRLIIHPQRSDRVLGTVVLFGAGNVYVKASSIEMFQLAGTWPQMMLLDGRYVFRNTLSNNSATSILVPPVANGSVTVTSPKSSNTVASFFVSSGTLVPGTVGSEINLSTGTLTGTTGPTSKLNVSLSGGSLYLENRLGASYNVTVVGNLG